MVEITNINELNHWFQENPKTAVAAIALRCALRILPIALFYNQEEPFDLYSHSTLALLRATSISVVPFELYWHNGPQGLDPALFRDSVNQAAAHARIDGIGTPALSVSYAALTFGTENYLNVIDSATRAANTALQTIGNDGSNFFFSQINWDITPVETDAPTQDWSRLPLWKNGVPDLINDRLSAMRTNIKNSEVGFNLWMDWYERRLAGRVIGFALPPEQDAIMHQRLVLQTDDWWKRAPKIVNAEIQSWLDELTPDKEAAQLEALLTRLELGAKPDFSQPETQLLKKAILERLQSQERRDLQAIAAEITNALPVGIGHNNPPDSDFDDAPEAVPYDLVRIEQRLVVIEEQLKKPEPDAVILHQETSSLIRGRDKLRALLRKGKKIFYIGYGGVIGGLSYDLIKSIYDWLINFIVDFANYISMLL